MKPNTRYSQPKREVPRPGFLSLKSQALIQFSLQRQCVLNTDCLHFSVSWWFQEIQTYLGHARRGKKKKKEKIKEKREIKIAETTATLFFSF